MAKLFSTKTHGMLDYLTAGQLLALPRMLGLGPGVSGWVQGMGVGTALYSLVTRYELGVIKVLPMPAHLALDVLSGVSFCAAAALLENQSTTVRATLAATGAFEIFAGLSTESRPASERATGSYRTVPVDEVVAPLRERGVKV